MGRVYTFACIQIIYALIVTVGCYLSYHKGINAVAYTVTGAIIISFLLQSFLASRITNLSVIGFLKTIIPGLIVSALLFTFMMPCLLTFREFLSPIQVFCLVAILVGIFCVIVFISPYKWLWGENGLWLRSEVVRVLRKALPSL